MISEFDDIEYDISPADQLYIVNASERFGKGSAGDFYRKSWGYFST